MHGLVFPELCPAQWVTPIGVLFCGQMWWVVLHVTIT